MAVCVVVRHHLPVALVVEEGAVAVVHCVVANRHQPVHDENHAEVEAQLPPEPATCQTSESMGTECPSGGETRRAN